MITGKRKAAADQFELIRRQTNLTKRKEKKRSKEIREKERKNKRISIKKNYFSLNFFLLHSKGF